MRSSAPGLEAPNSRGATIMRAKPNDETELVYLSASEVRALFEARELSPVEYLEALIARAERVEPAINAFAFTYYDEAMDQAKEAEARFAKRDAPLRPLEGLPCVIKDEMDLAGKLTTNGSLYLKDSVSTETHYSIERLLEAGAIVHARTTTPEFSCAGVAASRVHGVTSTPWNKAYTCGGSSGGSGASLAAGSTPLATGSDIGGSIRIPAAACGVVGYKPPYGRNPDNTMFAYDMYAVVGPMTRTIEDCILMQNVMCGPHPLDNACIRPKYLIPREFESVEGLSIAYSVDLDYFEVDDDVRRNTLRTLDVLKDLGAKIVEVEFGWSAEADRAVQNYLDHLFGGYIASYVDSDPSLATEWAVYCAEAHKKVGAMEFMGAYEVQTEMARKVGAILEEHCALICPTMGSHEIPADHKPDEPVIINGKSVDVLYGWCLCHPFNMLGRCPVLSIPSGFGDNGLPTGIQVVARHLDDDRVFRVGTALERAQPWLDCAARRPSL
jgi:Asp-tRNA(Asn)/Glu-tRNA(Gln) amidotransferase A subunit family amidase